MKNETKLPHTFVENPALVLSDHKRYVELIDEIDDADKSIKDSFVALGVYLKEIRDRKLYEFDSYKDIYEFAKNKFNYSETSVKNFIGVAEKYVDIENEQLEEDFEGYSFTSLVELLPVPKEEILKSYGKSMTVKEIRNEKKYSQLTDSLKSIMKDVGSLADRFHEAINNVYKDYPNNYHPKVNMKCILNESKDDFEECFILVDSVVCSYRSQNYSLNNKSQFTRYGCEGVNYKDLFTADVNELEEIIKNDIDDFSGIEDKINKKIRKKELINTPSQATCYRGDLENWRRTIYDLIDLFGVSLPYFFHEIRIANGHEVEVGGVHLCWEGDEKKYNFRIYDGHIDFDFLNGKKFSYTIPYEHLNDKDSIWLIEDNSFELCNFIGNVVKAFRELHKADEEEDEDYPEEDEVDESYEEDDE